MRHKKLARQIEQMALVDQEVRGLARAMARNIENFLVYTTDGTHNQYIRNIIATYGYPTQNLIGKRAMKKFWLLVQHQDFDIDLQESCLKECNFEAYEHAHLTDRVLVNKGRKQIYGTQFMRSSNGTRLIPAPIESPSGAEKRRKNVGLKSLKIYAQEMNGVLPKKNKTRRRV